MTGRVRFHFPNIARVKLAVNRETQQAIAVKIIDLEKAADCYENVRKEVSGVRVACERWIKLYNFNNPLLFIDLYSSNASRCPRYSILWTEN